VSETTLLDDAASSQTAQPVELAVHVVVLEPPSARLLRLEDGDAVTVGRAPGSTVVVDDARVSRNHARIGRLGSRVFVRDLRSSNGTQVGAELVRGQERPLGDGATVRVGPVQLVITLANLPRNEVGEEPRPKTPAEPPLTDLVPRLVVSSAEMIELLHTARRIAASPASVLISGETGSGKELIAEQIHRWSSRVAGPFLRLNCAAVPESLLESELFGYERGAFTGAVQRKVGYLEAASGGSLLLDEIGELPLEAQAKLLRVLEAKVVTRLGGTREVPLDVRLIYATHRDLEAEARAGRFREDLFFRIATFVLTVPPLRQRPNDIIALTAVFADEIAARMGLERSVVTAQAMARLMGYRWPGNVRELRNATEHAVVLAGGQPIGEGHLPARLRGDAEPGLSKAGVLQGELDEVERRRVEAALRAEGGNQTRAAARLGISRRGLIRKLSKHGISPR
jgi:DNA-binding NtrC family response regulator